jgi:hypothetical protein
MMQKPVRRKLGTWRESFGKKVSWILQGKKAVDSGYKRALLAVAGLAPNRRVQPWINATLDPFRRVIHLMWMIEKKT